MKNYLGLISIFFALNTVTSKLENRETFLQVKMNSSNTPQTGQAGNAGQPTQPAAQPNNKTQPAQPAAQTPTTQQPNAAKDVNAQASKNNTTLLRNNNVTNIPNNKTNPDYNVFSGSKNIAQAALKDEKGNAASLFRSKYTPSADANKVDNNTTIPVPLPFENPNSTVAKDTPKQALNNLKTPVGSIGPAAATLNKDKHASFGVSSSPIASNSKTKDKKFKPNGKSIFENQDNWAGACKSGKLQSPIDLSNTKSLVGHTAVTEIQSKPVSKSIKFDKTGVVSLSLSQNLSFKVTNVGQVVTAASKTQTAAVKCDQVMFKYPAEHTLNSNKVGMEIQFKCNSKGKPLRYVYISALVEGTSQKGIQAGQGLDFKQQKATNWDIGQLLNNKSKFIAYQGSFTIPPCTEPYLWLVTSAPVTVSQDIIDALKDKLFDIGVKENTRKVQDTNNRPLYLLN